VGRTKGGGEKLGHERGEIKNDLRSRVYPQKASRDARGLLERPIVRQTKVGARRESQHAARDRRHEGKQRRSRKIPSRADNEKTKRTSTKQGTQRHEA
jgi:hypothetical protein